jgi:hypothetical protein
MVLRLEVSASGWETPSLEAPTSPLLLESLRRGTIGDDEVLDGPYGLRRVIYCRLHRIGAVTGFIGDFIRDQVLPHYATTHTESSGTGQQIPPPREDARRRSATPSANPRLPLQPLTSSKR